MASDEHAKAQTDPSPNTFVALFVGIVTPDIFRAFALGNRLLANLTGLLLMTVVLYIAPPRPKLWKMLLLVGSLALAYVALYSLHPG
jgi:hypothetical protein